MSVSKDKARINSMLSVPGWDGTYTFESVLQHWVDILKVHPRKVDPYVAQLAKRSIESGRSTSWSGPPEADVWFRLLNDSVFTGVWVTVWSPSSQETPNGLRRKVVRGIYGLAQLLGRHIRYLEVSAYERRGRAHVHVLIETSWVVRGSIGDVSIYSALIPLLPDGNVYFAPYVVGGGALEYTIDHTRNRKRMVDDHVKLTTGVAYPSEVDGRPGARLHEWESPYFSVRGAFDRSQLPRPLVVEVRDGQIVRCRPPRNAKRKAQGTRTFRRNTVMARRVENDVRAEAGLKRLKAFETAEKMLAKLRKARRPHTWTLEDDMRYLDSSFSDSARSSRKDDAPSSTTSDERAARARVARRRRAMAPTDDTQASSPSSPGPSLPDGNPLGGEDALVRDANADVNAATDAAAVGAGGTEDEMTEYQEEGRD